MGRLKSRGRRNAEAVCLSAPFSAWYHQSHAPSSRTHRLWGVIYGGFDGGFSGIMLAACWNVPGELCSRLFFPCFLAFAGLTLRVISGKLLRKFLPLVEETIQSRKGLCCLRGRANAAAWRC